MRSQLPDAEGRLPAACCLLPAAYRRSRGFTLIEVLVALVIFGILTVALSFTFDTAMKTQLANMRRVEELQAVRSVFDYMTVDISRRTPLQTIPPRSSLRAAVRAGDRARPTACLP